MDCFIWLFSFGLLNQNNFNTYTWGNLKPSFTRYNRCGQLQKYKEQVDAASNGTRRQILSPHLVLSWWSGEGQFCRGRSGGQILMSFQLPWADFTCDHLRTLQCASGLPSGLYMPKGCLSRLVYCLHESISSKQFSLLDVICIACE